MENIKMADDLQRQLKQQKESLITLLNHMPAMTFSKDVETGVYLACNQAFAEYAHKETPAGVAGLTDFEIFEEPVAAHFVEDDKKALQMDKPYVFYEDVADAAGNPRQFQTTKLKFYDETGRLCLLGMSMDVTEMERVKKEREEAESAYQEAVSTRAIYESIVDTLSDDYFNLYYVDLDTDAYIEYGFRTEEGHRASESRGEDFFGESKKNADVFIYEKDRERFIEALDKENLIREIRKHGTFHMQYRLMLQGEPTYVNLKATLGKRDDHHIIIGVTNIDTQIKAQAAARRAAEDRKAYLRFSALNNNLIVLYLVDLETEHFQEFIATNDYKKLGIEQEGDGFFATSVENSRRTVHPDDQAMFRSHVTKDEILSAIQQDGVFLLDYRMLNGGLPSYVRLKASMFEEEGKKTLVIGLLDEDAQIRQERKIADDLTNARKMAMLDALTGVKNKNAYNEAENQMNQRIEEGKVSEFGVGVFDLNDLKLINDNRGHEVGDEYIKQACRMICTCFKHSPVFRIGGDEFAVILEGSDYVSRKELLENFERQVLINLERDGAVIAFGCAQFVPKQDSNVRQVFERADAMMYKEKTLLKGLGEEGGEGIAKKTEKASGFEELPVINMRKHLLIVDDVESNREILGDLLEDDYDILYAADGVEALEQLHNHKDEIALVLLDLYMPKMNGRDVISRMQVDEELMFIPVIFISVDLKAELDCLRLGALDFIPKPYPEIEIIKARITRCIELAENRDLIRTTQRDKLTGLYNIDYFLRYVSRYDQYYKDDAFDAIVCNVNHFQQLTEENGRQFGDLLLRNIGIGLSKLARKTGGLGCRKEGDVFLLYCRHQEDYDQLLKKFTEELFLEEKTADKVTLRFGIYENANREPDVETRFIRAGKAADEVNGDPVKIYRLYEFGEQ